MLFIVAVAQWHRARSPCTPNIAGSNPAGGKIFLLNKEASLKWRPGPPLVSPTRMASESRIYPVGI